ncbi:hypothetical protein [Mailhella massiliensis]|uniref:Uncharacterized protein n=1 Tax=Mailhella massiliensis TaxID=1903261 RepID=A0A921AWL1_9BACT|nr:hypothetical protein [Mailhella massiliensis]HJD97391.1 hypothetical protein [Mailhella massiliensis]
MEEGFYRIKSPYSGEEIFVTSLSFDMEQKSYREEGCSSRNITQVSFEDILDEFDVYMTDFYEGWMKRARFSAIRSSARTELKVSVRCGAL